MVLGGEGLNGQSMFSGAFSEECNLFCRWFIKAALTEDVPENKNKTERQNLGLDENVNYSTL